MSGRLAFAGLAAMVLLTRLAHSGILWDEEGYPLAAAIQTLYGKVIYRDFWFDKPPLFPAVYLLAGARDGWPLRVLSAACALGACWVLHRFALELWGKREALLAATLCGFFLTFWVPPAVIALGPDSLMIAPHAAAVWCAWRGRAFVAGCLAGVAVLLNVKGVFVLLACALWAGSSLGLLLAGFVAPLLVAMGSLFATGALVDYWHEVWEWGFRYAADSPFPSPIAEGLRRTANWAGFHLAAIAGAIWFFWRGRTPGRARFALWFLVSLVAVTVGWRFFPRYYLHLLPVSVLAASRGIVLAGRKGLLVAALLLTIPLVRFGPRYVTLAADLISGREHSWQDLALNQDGRAAASLITSNVRPGDTLLVWGYRADLFAYTRLPAASPFLDSQPLTGVVADRHLTSSTPTAPQLAAANRAALTQTHPTWIVDGLGPLNPALAITAYPELREWLAGYREAGRTRFSVIYAEASRVNN